jgi:hypothetical protein
VTGLLLVAALAQITPAPALPDELPVPPPFPRLRWGVGLGGGATIPDAKPADTIALAVLEGRLGVTWSPRLATSVQLAAPIGAGVGASLTALAEFFIVRRFAIAAGLGGDVAFFPNAPAWVGGGGAAEAQVRLLLTANEAWADPDRLFRSSLFLALAAREIIATDGRWLTQVRLVFGTEGY